MTDKELLELAAKAAGIDLITWTNMYDACDEIGGRFITQPRGEPWNPLEDDGDALRLLVTLKLGIIFHHTLVIVGKGKKAQADEMAEDYRFAIVRAAADLGKAMT